MKSYKNAKVNPKSEMSVVKLISALFSNLSILDAAAVRHNIEAASEGGMTSADRTIENNKLDYIVDNFGCIEILLLGDASFRNTVRRYVLTEISFDDKKQDEINKIREKNKEEAVSAGYIPDVDSENIIINLSKYNEAVNNDIRNRIIKSFNVKPGMETVIKRLISGLSLDDKICVSYCVSNFMYFLRAFSNNDVFSEWVKNVVNNFKRNNNIL